VCHYPEEEYLNDLLDDLRDYYWEEEYLKYMRDHARKTRDLFGNKGKQESERMVCRAFLKCAGIPFTEESIKSGDDPPDVLFDKARFEVCLLLDEGRKPNEEWKQVANAKEYEDVRRPHISPKFIRLAELIPLVTDKLKDKFEYYATGVCGTLDALVYVNLLQTFFVPTSPGVIEEQLETESLDIQSWRSVSVVMLFSPTENPDFQVPLCYHAAVLTATSTAPQFIRERCGHILNEWPYQEGWFEPNIRGKNY
jgi:hypothetical protein